MRRSPAGPAQWAVHLEVIDHLVRYLAGVDGRDWAAAGACFTPGGTLRFGDTVLQGPDVIAGRVGVDLGRYTLTQHQLGNPVAEVSGESGARTATVTAHCIGTHVWDDGGRRQAVVGGGYAAILAEQPGGGWLLADLAVSYRWQLGDDMAH